MICIISASLSLCGFFHGKTMQLQYLFPKFSAIEAFPRFFAIEAFTRFSAIEAFARFSEKFRKA